MEIFYLPDSEKNSITKTDVSSGILRVTINSKKYFPNSDSELKIWIGEDLHFIKYSKRNSKSDILYLGKSIMNALSVRSKTKIRFYKLSPKEYRIENASFIFSNSETDDINFEKLSKLKVKYWDSLKRNPFPPPPKSGTSIEMIKYFKRNDNESLNNIGPYFGISVFEAANRIASDLVIINGVLQLINDKKEPFDSIFTIRLGNKHVPNKGDFTINGKEGEAFNVASSFYKIKLRNTTKKWLEKDLFYILVNAEVFDELTETNLDKKIIKVINWEYQ
jgi:hypothetical protein